MGAPLSPDPTALASALRAEVEAVEARLTPPRKPSRLGEILLQRVEGHASAMSPAASPPLDEKGLAARAKDMADDLDALEDLLEALVLAAPLADG